MGNRFNKIYIWSFILLALIIIAVLYSPFAGRTQISSGMQYGYTLQPGVDFREHIVNSPVNRNNGSSVGTGLDESSLTGGTSVSGNNNIISGGVNGVEGLSDVGSAGGGGMVLSESSRAYNSYGNGDGNGSFIAGGASRRNQTMSPGNSGSIPSGEMTRLSQNLGIPDTGDAGADHTGGSSYGDGATDPGTDPDEETVIPVGGNEIYLAIMALLYITLKTRFFKRKTT